MISVVEPHVVELGKIFSEKRAEIKKNGMAYWTYRSDTDMVAEVQHLGIAALGRVPCYFLSVGKGYDPQHLTSARRNKAETHYSVDRKTWYQLPGRVPSNSESVVCALVLDEVAPRSGNWFDLWEYGNFKDPECPVRFSRAGSTVGAVLSDTSAHPKRMKTNPRPLLAVGYLVEPYAVWLKADDRQSQHVDYVEDGIMPTILGNIDW